jgi:hypothetical protein
VLQGSLELGQADSERVGQEGEPLRDAGSDHRRGAAGGCTFRSAIP